MIEIKVDSFAGEKHATALGQAADEFTIRNLVNFSGQTTIMGNRDAQDVFADLQTAADNTQEIIQRDMNFIQSVVKGFERKDLEIKQANQTLGSLGKLGSNR